MKLTKKAILEIQVEERKKAKAKQKQSEFMKRSLSIFNGQKSRAAELGQQLPFTLEEFRSFIGSNFDKRFCSCGAKITIKGMAVDHRVPISRGGGWDLSNLAVICKPCNFRKGVLLPEEFQKLQDFVLEEFTPESREDLWRRLTLGGKWSFGR